MLSIRESKHLRLIPYEDIQSATKNFTTLIGRGGYGPVYRGQLTLSGELTIVAVKRLQTDYGQGVKEFLTEIQLLSRYKHQNLVSLVGLCEEHNEKFLIYEYAEHGSLDKYIKPFKTRCPLTWKQRINICVDAARGLDHLHNHVAQNERVIHRDIKSSNILLDHNWKAMIADFGLSKIGRANENDTYLITNPAGTHGYCDPAYINTGILTKESDVYSFGVVLFEVLCGRLCFINVNSKERFLVPLAQRYYKQGKLNLIVDTDLKNYMNSDSIKVFSDIAFQCLQDDREQRPSMGLVLEKLEKALKLLEIEEAPELLELEEVLGLQKLVETFQMQEACELQELEVALGLHIGESLIDYDVIKAIYGMRDTPLSYVTIDEMFSHLSTGILVDEGKVWVSVDDDGKTQEMISAIKVLSLDGDGFSIRSVPESRFSKIADISFSQFQSMQVKIRTQFLSSDVTYAAYLVCKPDSTFLRLHMEELGLVYTLNYTSESHVSYSHKIDDNGWWMFELFQTINLERTAVFEVKFHIMDGPLSKHHLLFEGIRFQPIQKFLQFEDVDEIGKSDLPIISTSNIEWGKLLPDDYKQYLYYSNNEMMKTPQKDVIFPTKEEAYSILSGGVLIKVNNVGNMWFWITKLGGKKCFMLLPKLHSYGEQWDMLPSEASRVEYRIHLFSSNTVVVMSVDVPNRLMSTDTTYGCYLVYRMRPDFVWKTVVKIKLDDHSGVSKDHVKLMHLSIPQSPVIGPHGVLRSPNPINDLKPAHFPKRRKDGWLEVNLGDTSHIQWTNMQQDELSNVIRPRDKSTWKSWCLPCMLNKESGNVSDNDKHNNFTLDSRCFSNMDIYLSSIEEFVWTPELFLQGIEFRPL